MVVSWWIVAFLPSVIRYMLVSGRSLFDGFTSTCIKGAFSRANVRLTLAKMTFHDVR